VTWSNDGLQTWAAPRTIVTPSGHYASARPYVKYASNGWDTILLAFTDGHPRNEPHDSVYAMTLRAGLFRTVTGTVLASLDGRAKGIPTAPVRLTSVPRTYDGAAATGKAWVWSAALDSAGHPVIAFATFPNDRDHRYWYARWTGTAWSVRQFARAGGSIAASGDEPDYSGGMDLDHSDPATLYASREVHGQWEVERWHTPDGGRTWDRPVPLTTRSRVRQIRPVVPWGPPGDVQVLWMAGRYDSWQDGYSTALLERTTGPAVTTVSVGGARSARAGVPFTLTGRLVRGTAGAPVAGAEVSVLVGPLPVARAVTDATGRYSVSVSQLVATSYAVRFAGTSEWGQAQSRAWRVGAA
jgi:hypothetical protein